MKAQNSKTTKSPLPVAYSVVNDHTYLLMPGDLNANNTAFGGRLMEIADRVAGTVAMRHSHSACVTLLVDSMKFLKPAKQGDLLIFKASLNRAWNTSMEIGVKILAENIKTNIPKHIVSAYFTFVAINDNQRPRRIRPVVPETAEEKRRYQEADRRRQQRIKNTKNWEILRLASEPLDRPVPSAKMKTSTPQPAARSAGVLFLWKPYFL